MNKNQQHLFHYLRKFSILLYLKYILLNYYYCLFFALLRNKMKKIKIIITSTLKKFLNLHSNTLNKKLLLTLILIQNTYK